MQSRRYFWLAALTLAAVGLLWRAPVLRTGFIVDDYAQLSMMQGSYPVPRAPLALFTFSSGQLAENRALRDAGFFPWWSDPGLRISLFRPLASALMWVDRACFGSNAFAYHVHSALWWCALITAWSLVLARLLPTAAALLALLLCVVHPAHGMLLGWIAARNASVAGASALFGVWAQLRAREQGWRWGPLWAAGAYTLALAASEYALGFIAFGLLYELCSSERLLRSALQRALVLLLGSYFALRSLLGFGTHGSGMYIDPLAEPSALLRASVERLPVLAADLVFGLRSNWWTSGYPWHIEQALAPWIPGGAVPLRAAHVGLGVCALAVAAWVAWLAQRAEPRLRFLAWGLPLSLLPALGSLPEARLLLPAVFGWSVLLAQLLAARIGDFRRQRGARALLRCVAPLSLFALELVCGVKYSAEEASVLPPVAEGIRRSLMTPELDAALVGVRRALLVTAIDPTTTIYLPLLRHWHGRPWPEQCQLLLSTYSRLRLERLSATSFRLERLDTRYDPQDLYSRVFNRAPLFDGQRFESGGMRVQVEHAHNGLPWITRFELDVSLEDPSTVLLIQTAQGVRKLEPPAIGTSVILDPPSIPVALIDIH